MACYYAAASGKRDYKKWSVPEERIFFDVLRSDPGSGQKECVAAIASRLPEKDKDQVRQYYYRIIKRLNKIGGDNCRLGDIAPMELHRAMLKYWEVVVSVAPLHLNASTAILLA
jgi:hypothetical protein